MASSKTQQKFGVSYSTFTVDKLEYILSFHGVKFSNKDRKPDLFEKLSDLEGILFEEEERRIRDFVFDNVPLGAALSLLQGPRPNFTSKPQTKPTSTSDHHGVKRKAKEPLVRPVSCRAYKSRVGEGEVEDEGPQLSPKIKPLTPATIQCAACLEDLLPGDFPKNKLTPTCGHDLQTCNECTVRSVDLQVKDTRWDQIHCSLCNELLTFDTVKEWVSPELFERFDRQSVLSAFKDMPDFTMCLNTKCDSGQLHDGGEDQPIMTCMTCSFKTCYLHKMPWHEGQTCAEYDEERRERTKEEAASVQFLEQETKVCPNAKCGIHIVKSTGCDHMTCKSCKYEFCWLCFASYTAIRLEGNTAHSASCRHHTRNIRGPPRERHTPPPPRRRRARKQLERGLTPDLATPIGSLGQVQAVASELEVLQPTSPQSRSERVGPVRDPTAEPVTPPQSQRKVRVQLRLRNTGPSTPLSSQSRSAAAAFMTPPNSADAQILSRDESSPRLSPSRSSTPLSSPSPFPGLSSPSPTTFKHHGWTTVNAPPTPPSNSSAASSVSPQNPIDLS